MRRHQCRRLALAKRYEGVTAPAYHQYKLKTPLHDGTGFSYFAITLL